MTDKKALSERDIITQFIIPSIKNAGWDIEKQVREEVSFTDGRIFVKGDKTARGEKKRADIILYYKPNIPVAIIEAKDNSHDIGSGMQQALNYAKILDIPVAFSSNGDEFLEHDRSGYSSHTEKIFDLNSFPSPRELWNKYNITKVLPQKNRRRYLHSIIISTALAETLDTTSRLQ